MSVAVLAAVAVSLPLVGGFFVLALGKWPNAREAASLVTATSLFLVVYSMLGPVRAGTVAGLTLVEVMPGVTLGLQVEPLGLLFALVASFLWIVTTLYAIGYMRGHHEENQTRFYFFFAVSIAAAMGAAFSANLFTLFAFYELLTLCTFPLVTHHGTEEARKAAASTWASSSPRRSASSSSRSSGRGRSPARSISAPAASSPARRRVACSARSSCSSSSGWERPP